jgi:uridine kinase
MRPGQSFEKTIPPTLGTDRIEATLYLAIRLSYSGIGGKAEREQPKLAPERRHRSTNNAAHAVRQGSLRQTRLDMTKNDRENNNFGRHESGDQITYTAERANLLHAIADQIIATAARRVAVDGVDGSGKTIFADQLAAVLRHRREVARVSIDDFHAPRSLRYRRGPASPEGFWLDSYDYATFVRDTVAAFEAPKPARYRLAAHDLDTDESVSRWAGAGADAVLIVDGIFLHRPELITCWQYSIFLAVPFEETARRMALRDGTPPDPEHPGMRRYVEGQRIYMREASPETSATLIVDNTDPSTPFILPR